MKPNKENDAPDIAEISYKDIWDWVVGDGSKPEAFDVPEDETNYDLNKIPPEEWADYELKNLYVSPDCPTDDPNELVWWLERYYDLEARNFNGYVSIDCLIEDGPIVFAPDKPSRIVFHAGRPAGPINSPAKSAPCGKQKTLATALDTRGATHTAKPVRHSHDNPRHLSESWWACRC